MPFFNGFPYSDYDQINLDWVIKTCQDAMAKAVESLGIAADTKEYVDNYFADLDVQQEINNKIDQMADDGDLLALMNDTITDVVQTWLASVITNPNSPPLDTTLTLPTAAAPAKTVGDALDVINAELSALHTTDNEINATIDDITETGVNMVNQERFLMDPNWAYDSVGGYYYGDMASAHFKPLETVFADLVFEPNTQYTISFDALNQNATSGTGFGIWVRYAGDVAHMVATVPRSTATFTNFSYTTTAGETVEKITLSIYSGPSDIWEIKNLVIRKGVVGTYVPYYISAVDLVARDNISTYIAMASTYDTTDRTSDILTALQTKGICTLGEGDFYISSLKMPANSKLYGSGKATHIIMAGSDILSGAAFLTADLRSYANAAIAPEGIFIKGNQAAGQLNTRSPYLANTSYLIRIRAQALDNLANAGGLTLYVKYIGETATEVTNWGQEIKRNGDPQYFSYDTDPTKTIERLTLSYYSGPNTTWHISEFTVIPVTLADGAGTAGNAIVMSPGSELAEFSLMGAEASLRGYNTETPPAGKERTGILIKGRGNDDPGKWFNNIHDLWISNFNDYGIYAEDTGYSSRNGATITNVYVNACGKGIGLYRFAEYFRLETIRAYFCSVGILCNGGNNVISNSDFSLCQTGIKMDDSSGTMTNNSHGQFVGCTVNHTYSPAWVINGGTTFDINHMTVGEMFVGCHFSGGDMVIIDGYGMMFTGCSIAPNGPNNLLSITGAGSSAFTGCLFANVANISYPTSGTRKVHFSNCVDRANGSLVDLEP